MIKKAIIPAAGYGTRGLPITKVIPKEMFPINKKPAIDYIIKEAENCGIEEVLIIISSSKSSILDYYEPSLELEAFLKNANKSHLLEKLPNPKVQIYYTSQPFAKGLGDAIRIGKDFVKDEPFAVLLPDDIVVSKYSPALKQILGIYKKHQKSVIGLNKVPVEHLNQYGVIKGKAIDSDTMHITDIVEKPEIDPPSDLAVIGRYIFTPKIFDELEKIERGSGGEYQITDAIKKLIFRESVYGKVIKGKRYDIGREKDYIELLSSFNSE